MDSFLPQPTQTTTSYNVTVEYFGGAKITTFTHTSAPITITRTIFPSTATSAIHEKPTESKTAAKKRRKREREELARQSEEHQRRLKEHEGEQEYVNTTNTATDKMMCLAKSSLPNDRAIAPPDGFHGIAIPARHEKPVESTKAGNKRRREELAREEEEHKRKISAGRAQMMMPATHAKPDTLTTTAPKPGHGTGKPAQQKCKKEKRLEEYALQREQHKRNLEIGTRRLAAGTNIKSERYGVIKPDYDERKLDLEQEQRSLQEQQKFLESVPATLAANNPNLTPLGPSNALNRFARDRHHADGTYKNQTWRRQETRDRLSRSLEQDQHHNTSGPRSKAAVMTHAAVMAPVAVKAPAAVKAPPAVTTKANVTHMSNFDIGFVTMPSVPPYQLTPQQHYPSPADVDELIVDTLRQSAGKEGRCKQEEQDRVPLAKADGENSQLKQEEQDSLSLVRAGSKNVRVKKEEQDFVPFGGTPESEAEVMPAQVGVFDIKREQEQEESNHFRNENPSTLEAINDILMAL